MKRNKIFRIILFTIVVLVLIFVSYISNKNFSDISNQDRLYGSDNININDLNNLSFLQSKLIYSNKIKVFILIRFSDFNCSTCYINFLNFSDSLNSHFTYFNESTLFLIERDNRDFLVQQKFIEHWKRQQKIKYQHIFVQDFARLPVISKSSILVRGKNIFHVFPLPIPQSEFLSTFKALYDGIKGNNN